MNVKDALELQRRKCNSCKDKENYPNCDCETRIIREALNKQIRIKVVDIHESDRVRRLYHGNCPICKTMISTYDDKVKSFCDNCGHAILWMR